MRDPFGHEWLLGGHLETLTSEEMQRRYTALFQKGQVDARALDTQAGGAQDNLQSSEPQAAVLGDAAAKP